MPFCGDVKELGMRVADDYGMTLSYGDVIFAHLFVDSDEIAEKFFADMEADNEKYVRENEETRSE